MIEELSVSLNFEKNNGEKLSLSYSYNNEESCFSVFEKLFNYFKLNLLNKDYKYFHLLDSNTRAIYIDELSVYITNKYFYTKILWEDIDEDKLEEEFSKMIVA